jgi:hypothetical protein
MTPENDVEILVTGPSSIDTAARLNGEECAGRDFLYERNPPRYTC